jgi:hypothetical protein
MNDVLLRDYVLLLTQLALDPACPYRLMAVQKLSALALLLDGQR